MNSQQRSKILRILDDRPDAAPWLFHIYQLQKCDAIFDWLIQNKLMGQRFMELAKVHGTPLTLLTFLVSKVEKDPMRPLFVDKDFVS